MKPRALTCKATRLVDMAQRIPSFVPPQRSESFEYSHLSHHFARFHSNGSELSGHTDDFLLLRPAAAQPPVQVVEH